MATPQKNKRVHSISDEEGDTSSNNINWPRFVVIRGKDTNLTKNPFLIAKSIQAIAGEVKSVKHLRDGSLLVEWLKHLLTLSTFAGIAVDASPHTFLNSSKGIVRDMERILRDVPEQEIVEGLSSQDVTHVKP